MFGWDLPPGVTPKMIDDAFGGGDVCQSCDDGEHEDCEKNGCECDDCAEAARDAYYEDLRMEQYYERRFGEG